MGCRDLRVQTPFELDKERLYDDFIFMCFFVGNDFLPHMPTLEIREGAIDLLMATYKRMLPSLGHLVEGPHVYLDRVERFISEIGSFEDSIFQKRMKMLQRQKNRRRQQREQQKSNQNRDRNNQNQHDRYFRGNAVDTSKKNLKWTSRAPPAEIAAQAQSLASSMSKSAKLAAAFKAPLKRETLKLDSNSKDFENEKTSNRGAAELLRKRMRSSTGDIDNSSDTKSIEEKKNENDVENMELLSTKKRKKEELIDAEIVKESRQELIEVETKSGQKSVTFQSNVATRASELWEDMGGDTNSSIPSAQKKESKNGEDLEEIEKEEEAEAEDELREIIGDADVEPEAAAQLNEAVEAFKEKLKEEVKEKADKFDEMVEHEERIRLGEAGFKDRYYTEKLGIQDAVERGAVVRKLVQAYVEGLVWVMRYYYDGVASWTWYYPFHYAPFASDLIGLSSMDIKFELGKPFKPFDQLMGVFPAASAHALPKPYQPLFTDKDSPILDFYPRKFEVDMNGKRFSWQGVALLPFIDETRLLEATRSKEHLLSEEESFRNGCRCETLFVSGSHPLAPDIFEAKEHSNNTKKNDANDRAHPIDPESSQGMAGCIAALSGDPCPAVVPAPYTGLGADITSNSVVAAAYLLPEHREHILSLLPGAKEDEPELNDEDVLPETQLWHEDRFPQNRRNFSRQYTNGFQGDGRQGQRNFNNRQSEYSYSRESYRMQAFYPAGDRQYNNARGHSRERRYHSERDPARDYYQVDYDYQSRRQNFNYPNQNTHGYERYGERAYASFGQPPLDMQRSHPGQYEMTSQGYGHPSQGYGSSRGRHQSQQWRGSSGRHERERGRNITNNRGRNNNPYAALQRERR